MYESDRLVRAVTTQEPRWTNDDRGYLLALEAEEREVCPGCKQPLAECRDPATARQWEVVPERCQACIPLQAKLDDAGNESRGWYFAVRRTT